MHQRSAQRLARGVGALALLAAMLAPGAGAEPPAGKTLDDAVAEEVKALVPVMRAAAKSDHRRQAWYVARRILAAVPKHAEASEVAQGWKPETLVEGVDPEKGFVARRDAAFAKAGAAYAAVVRSLLAEGKKPADVWPAAERALAYGVRDADVVATVPEGQLWAGTWGAVLRAGKYDEWVMPLGGAVTWPPEWDDDFLKAKAFWPEARVSRIWEWRIVASLPPDEMWRVIGTLASLETQFVETLGSIRKAPRDAKQEEDELTDLLLVPDAALYEKIGLADLKDAAPEDRSRFKAATGWHDQGRRRLLVLAKHPTDPWIGEDANWVGHAAKVLAREHLGPPTGWLSGRGTWILDGVRGVYEGFVPKGTTGGEIDYTRCWRLSAARALKKSGALPSWETLLDLDRRQADDFAPAHVKFRFAEEERDVEKVDVVAAAATALVASILRSDKGAKRLSTLLQETMKRDRIPDLDKVLGGAKGHALREADKLLDMPERR